MRRQKNWGPQKQNCPVFFRVWICKAKYSINIIMTAHPHTCKQETPPWSQNNRTFSTLSSDKTIIIYSTEIPYEWHFNLHYVAKLRPTFAFFPKLGLNFLWLLFVLVLSNSYLITPYKIWRWNKKYCCHSVLTNRPVFKKNMTFKCQLLLPDIL